MPEPFIKSKEAIETSLYFNYNNINKIVDNKNVEKGNTHVYR